MTQKITIPAVAWEEVLDRYFEIVHSDAEYMPMIDLILQIINSELSNRLFAYTSLNRLIISIYNPIELNRETLKIEFNSISKTFNFVYHSRPQENPTFIRDYSSDDLLSKFDAFIRLARW